MLVVLHGCCGSCARSLCICDGDCTCACRRCGCVYTRPAHFRAGVIVFISGIRWLAYGQPAEIPEDTPEAVPPSSRSKGEDKSSPPTKKSVNPGGIQPRRRKRKKSSRQRPELEHARDTIRERIIGGQYPVNGRLPSHLDFAGELGISEHTVGDAIAELREKGYVTTVSGSGSYVSPPESWPKTGTEPHPRQ